MQHKSHSAETIFFFQAEDGIRDLVRSRGLGDVYKRQVYGNLEFKGGGRRGGHAQEGTALSFCQAVSIPGLSLIHI